MTAKQEELITKFIKSYPRFRLAITKELFDDSPYLDVGENVARFLSSNGDVRHNANLDIVVQNHLSSAINNYIHIHPLWGKVLYIRNIGILFEPELQLGVNNFIQLHTQNVLWVLTWNGDFDDQTLYLTTQGSKYKIDLSQINHIFL